MTFFKSDYSIKFNPMRLTSSIDWHGHLCFAAWIVEYFRPNIIVELGVFRGDSLSAFAQSSRDMKCKNSIYGIDKWIGDTTTGEYGEEVYADLKDYFIMNYPEVKLIREYFDDALTYFDDKSIDLLHIDGCHEYDAVKNDYTKWLPKISQKGIILFHDIAAYEANFGVYRFWSEIKDEYPSISFEHSNGLGVLFVGELVQKDILPLVDNDMDLEIFKSIFLLSSEKFIAIAKMKYQESEKVNIAKKLYELENDYKNLMMQTSNCSVRKLIKKWIIGK